MLDMVPFGMVIISNYVLYFIRGNTMNSLTDLSADELFKMAEQKRAEEHEQKTAHLREELKQLTDNRKALISDHKRDVSTLERQIKALTKQIGGNTSSSGRGRSGISKTIVELLSKNGPTDTKQLKQLLDEQGIEAKNINQQLAYLKRRGQVTNPERGVYSLVD
jgi:hypothetical protein